MNGNISYIMSHAAIYEAMPNLAPCTNCCRRAMLLINVIYNAHWYNGTCSPLQYTNPCRWPCQPRRYKSIARGIYCHVLSLRKNVLQLSTCILICGHASIAVVNAFCRGWRGEVRERGCNMLCVWVEASLVLVHLYMWPCPHNTCLTCVGL